MTKQEIQNMLNLCNQKAYILNHSIYISRKGDSKIQLQSMSFQHDMKYFINDIEISCTYIQNSLYDIVVKSSCTIDRQYYEASMIQSSQMFFKSSLLEDHVFQEIRIPAARTRRTRSFIHLEAEEIESIVKELKVIKDLSDYCKIQEKYYVHFKTLQKICKLYNLPIIKKKDMEDTIWLLDQRKKLQNHFNNR